MWCVSCGWPWHSPAYPNELQTLWHRVIIRDRITTVCTKMSEIMLAPCVPWTYLLNQTLWANNFEIPSISILLSWTTQLLEMFQPSIIKDYNPLVYRAIVCTNRVLRWLPADTPRSPDDRQSLIKHCVWLVAIDDCWLWLPGIDCHRLNHSTWT